MARTYLNLQTRFKDIVSDQIKGVVEQNKEINKN